MVEPDSTNPSKFKEDDNQVQRSNASSTVLPPRPCEVRIYSQFGNAKAVLTVWLQHSINWRCVASVLKETNVEFNKCGIKNRKKLKVYVFVIFPEINLLVVFGRNLIQSMLCDKDFIYLNVFQICKAPSSGYHFGVISCEACKV